MKRSVVFLGTPQAAVVVLEHLLQSHNVELVITQPDKKRGRGGRLMPSPVKEFAVQHGIDVAHDLDALDQLPSTENRVCVVVAFGRIIPTDVLERHPMINVHFSLLPRWRGAAPVERAIMSGDTTTGVCIMQIEPTLDTGPVYARAETPIFDDDTSTSLTIRLAQLGAQLLENLLSGEFPVPVPQNGTPTYAHKIESHERFISWHGASTDICRKVRSLSAFALVNGKRLGIVEVRDLPDTQGSIGVITPDAVAYAETGAVQLVRVQPEGRSPMSGSDWLRGLRDVAGLRCETNDRKAETL